MELTEFFQNVRVPATVVHVISVVVGMGSALVSDFLFSFYSKDKKLNETELSTLSVLAKIVLYGLVAIAFSGLLIFFSDVDKYMNSAKFLAKMSILVVLLVNGYFLNKYVWPHLLNNDFFTLKKEKNVRKLAFASGAVSVISWLSICTLGVLDTINMAYLAIISIYLAVVIFGIFVSILVEKREFN